MSDKVSIHSLATGAPGLDTLLGGGLPEFSFNLIAGTPGSGKTTLANHIMFSMATPNNRALFFTVLGEPALKMLRYQRQFSFFELDKISESVRYPNLSAELLDGNFDQLLSHILKEVKDYAPSLVFVDSFRSVARSGMLMGGNGSELRDFVQRLGIQMTSWQATTFLIGEYLQPEAEAGPVFTVADTIFWLTQSLYQNSIVRKIQVVKMRGQAQVAGLHAFRMSKEGIHVFPRAIVQNTAEESAITRLSPANKRTSIGVSSLDEMLGGGLPLGYSLLVVGPSGSGKTILATQFLSEGIRTGASGVIAAIEKSPSQLLNNDLNKLIESGHIGVINTRSLDLSIDEILHDLIKMINEKQAKRVVIDSLSGFELALAPEFQENFRGSLYRMIAELTNLGVTILMTSELEDRYTDLRFSPFGSAFLADAIIVQRYIEIGSEFKRVLSVIKVRGSMHSKDIRLFEITNQGIIMGEALPKFSGIMSGRPTCNPFSRDLNNQKIEINDE